MYQHQSIYQSVPRPHPQTQMFPTVFAPTSIAASSVHHRPYASSASVPVTAYGPRAYGQNYATTVVHPHATRVVGVPTAAPVFSTAVGYRPPAYAGTVCASNGYQARECGGYIAPDVREPHRYTVAPAYGTPIVGKSGREAFARSQAFQTLTALGFYNAAEELRW